MHLHRVINAQTGEYEEEEVFSSSSGPTSSAPPPPPSSKDLLRPPAVDTSEPTDSTIPQSSPLIRLPSTTSRTRFLVGPISLNAFSEPCICSDGHTYERSCIESWLATHSTSPMTRQQLPYKAVYSNKIVSLLLRIPDDESAFRRALTCPLSGKISVDPVFCVADSETYERENITNFLARSVVTLRGKRIADKTLIDNVVIRSLIEHARERGAKEREKGEAGGDKRKRVDSWDGFWTGFKGLSVGTVWGSGGNERGKE